MFGQPPQVPCGEGPSIGEGRFATNGGLEEEDMILYPNPASEKAMFRAGAVYDNASFIIYDIYGRELKRMENLNASEFEVDPSGLAEGLYLYRYIQGSNIISTGSFIISK